MAKPEEATTSTKIKTTKLKNKERCSFKSKVKANKKFDYNKFLMPEEDFVGNVFQISNDYFEENLFKLSTGIACNEGWYENLSNISTTNANNFKILHININSIFNKLQHIMSILDNLEYDIISLNEVKTDDNTTNNFLSHPKYNIIRRDRSRNGGGIIVYIKNIYNYSFKNSDNYEIISFRLQVDKWPNNTHNIICSYKPPNEQIDDYLDYLSTFILDNNLIKNLFLIGDLNMDLLADNYKRNFKNSVIRSIFITKTLNQQELQETKMET
jgi:hypothetical protein